LICTGVKDVHFGDLQAEASSDHLMVKMPNDPICNEGINVDITHIGYVKRGCTQSIAEVVKMGGESVDNITIKVQSGGCLLLKSNPTVISNAVCVELVGEDIFPQARYWDGDINMKSKLQGDVQALIDTFPNMKFLELRFSLYDVDWCSLQNCKMLRGFSINHYEDMSHSMQFPKHSITNFHGFASQFAQFPNTCDEVVNYMKHATQNSSDWSWSIGFYDTRHCSIDNSLKHDQICVQGRRHEELDAMIHVTTHPSCKP